MTKKKKIIIMSSLVFLLALTAVLNVLLVNNNPTGTTAATSITASNYFTTFRSERTSKRSEELLQLDSVIALYDEGSDRYNEAVDMKLKIVGMMENELLIETLVKSLGFTDAVVSISLDSNYVNVFVNSDEVDTDTTITIFNLLRKEAGIQWTNVILLPVYTQI